jgi:hypothetical protein
VRTQSPYGPATPTSGHQTPTQSPGKPGIQKRKEEEKHRTEEKEKAEVKRQEDAEALAILQSYCKSEGEFK